MNKDELKGKAKDVAGRVERQVGEWTDDGKMQGEGAARQAEGKVQKGFGKLKQGASDAMKDLRDKKDRDDVKKDNAA